MIIGANWTGSAADIALLEDWRKVLRLAKERTFDGRKLFLKGIADHRDISVAVSAASNGRRTIKLVPRTRQGNHFYGIYIG